MHGLNTSGLEEARREFGRFCAHVDFWDLPIAWRSAGWWARLALSPFFRAPYTCHALWSEPLDERWNQLLEQVRPDLVHFDSIDLGLYFRKGSPFPRVLHHHNCESAMMTRRAEKERNPLARLYLRHQAGKLRRLEQELCHRFQANVTVSEQDRLHLLALDPRAHVHVVENGTDTSYLSPIPGAEETDTLVFAGSLRWYPNLSGLEYFIEQVWPLLKQQRPQLRLYIAGRDPAASFLNWAQRDSSIKVVRDPDDIRPWIARGWVFICPILDGGGTRLKILDALAMGKAVVSTTIGCEGLQVTPGKDILVADSPRDFAAEVLRVLASADLRQQLAAAGRALVVQQYDWRALAAQLRDTYECALNPASCHQPAAVLPEAEIS
jgi:glycosyltransferase involved in cell wall biosynthesis